LLSRTVLPDSLNFAVYRPRYGAEDSFYQKNVKTKVSVAEVILKRR
jgi:hypothetical protein